MASQGVEEKEATASVAAMPVMFKIQIASHDESCAYVLSEAIQRGLRYQRSILQQPADPESWFSLYELRKVKPVEASVRIDPKKQEYTFLTVDSAIEFIERMLRESGYEVQRRPNWVHAVYLDPRQMAEDMGLVTSLVIAEHGWEVSVLHYRGLGEEYHKPRFLVVPDGAYTPQSKSLRRRSLSQAVHEPEEEDDAIVLKSPVKKVLNFADVSSSGSENGAPATPPTEGKSNALLDTLVEMTALGKISTDNFSKLIAGLNQRDVSHPEDARERRELPAKSGYPSRDESHDGHRRSSSYSHNWSANLESDMGQTSQDRSDFGDSQNGKRHSTTIIQNVQLKTFDGAKTDPEDARQWLSKFLHSANLAGWTSTQRLDAFADNLTNPACYWFRQLPPRVRNEWKPTLAAFHAKYCADNVSPMRLYHATTQKQDETPLNFFYRFNAAALRANLDIRRENEDDDWTPVPADLKDHLEFFWDSHHDSAVAERFRFDEYRSIAQVERLLSRRECTMVKQPKKKDQKRAGAESSASEQPPAAVNKVNQGGRAGGSDGGTSSSVSCEHCGRAGHTKASCFQLQKCDYGDKIGHTVTYCREFIEKMATIRIKVNKGELTTDELAQQLNK